VTIAFELWLYTVVRWYVCFAAADHNPTRHPVFIRLINLSELRKYTGMRKLWEATSYEDWKGAAVKVDEWHDKGKWKREIESPFYEAPLIQSVTTQIKQALQHNKIDEVQQHLMMACRNNLGGVENAQLYSHTYFGTKRLVNLYVDTVVKGVEAISASDAIENKGEILRKLVKTYGRTALCLSGGASFGTLEKRCTIKFYK